ncbi:translocase [Puniceibacterium confluentis]|uniref:translocase n=1 Tax=Puniceibacterium confluentis TaxID=1958944 RepID=UPI0011B64137|nr:translocase [Puniceibacterium confluentis]
MTRAKTYILGLGTFVCALTIGYIMQFGFALPRTQPQADASRMMVSEIVDTSSVGLPRTPSVLGKPAMPDSAAVLASVEGNPNLPLATDDRTGDLTCPVDLAATATAGAMVTLSLSAPCLGGERVTVHHNGLMFTEVTGKDGSLEVVVPALAQKALFIASFDNGDGAVASADVTSLGFYDRVALQWKGNTGLQLHAREFDAPYGGSGHIWNASTGDFAKTARGESGFLIQLGDAGSPDALLAEVYSFPVGTTESTGSIALSIEAEITADNCGTEVEAQSLELTGGGSMQVHDISLAVPDCDSIGDFLVLKKPLEDLTIASN